MKPLPHLYEVTLLSSPKGYATLLMDGVPELRSAPPSNFGGPGDAWSPEHLLLASVETCFVFTFRAVAEASKFDFLSLEVSGSGTVDRKDGATRFIDIVSCWLFPVVTTIRLTLLPKVSPGVAGSGVAK